MNIALIGYGYWGPNLARNILEIDEARLVGICEMNPARLERARSLYGDRVEIYTDNYKDLILHPDVDAVVIATQTEPSYQIIMESLHAGKHCFIEKPIASTVERAENIKKIAEESRLIVHCDHIMVFNPIIRYVKKMLDNGELGELMYIDISRINLGPIRKDVNAMLDLAVHDIAVIDYLSNGEQPNGLSALGQVLYGSQESITYLTLKYPNFIAHIKSSWVSPMKERRMMIAGSKKMVIFDDVKLTEKLTIYDHGFDITSYEEYGHYEVETRTGDIFIPNIKYEDSLKNSVLHFVECFRNNNLSLTGPDHSLRVMRILEEAMNSLRK
ncbi:Gfo/Idh/MocA family protein [Paenibacillus sedimenti]|uniref:Gfo/Idh/MocA family oxidoreductase n=1 Tax=Paenibacillus sedimenti TaxID=2770274 RepID=A0A926KXP8_9BACL|nr:Gfo/Idh/MocA family oxidoreductase [Paenibacillus sedimenti]MBD0384173.1 Gfo/Idh/MocA family oxidoreductase [Paenibacillus sedimenti]